MFLKLLVIIFICSACRAAFAENYALVVGGRSAFSFDHQNFAEQTGAVAYGLRAKGYRTTYLIGDEGVAEDDPFPGSTEYGVPAISSKINVETTKFKADFDQLKTRVGIDGPATPGAVGRALKNLVDTIKPGDRVEIFIAAHGTCIRNSNAAREEDRACTGHAIELDSGPDSSSFLDSSRILGFVRSLEAKGAVPTLTFYSCFSGALKNQVRSLPRTCSFLLSSQYGAGVGCVDTSGPHTKSYLSSSDFAGKSESPATGDVVALRYYAGEMASLSKIPFFSNNPCFQKMKDFMARPGTSNKIETVEGAFWAGRALDPNANEPVISTVLDEPYFQNHHFDSELLARLTDTTHQAKLLCFTRDPFAEIENQLSDAERPVVSAMKDRYFSSIQIYNRLITDQVEVISRLEAHGPSQVALVQIEKSQMDVDRQAQVVVLAERALVNEIFASKRRMTAGEANPCTRAF